MMPLNRLQALLRNLLKAAIVRGWLPFEWGGRPRRRAFRQAWRAGVPTTFNEKMQYKIMHDRRSIARIYADKLAVRAYVRAICPEVRLPKLLAQFQHEDELKDRLPPAPWVMKASHGSGMVLICDRPGAVSWEEIHARARTWLRTDYAVRFWEWQYLRLPRRILFEEFLGTGSATPDDYKFFVIHQQVRLIVVDQARYANHAQNGFWPDWTPIESRVGRHPHAAVPPARPAQLEKMIAIAERLGRDSDCVRVDLYGVRGEVYFGEITHSPSAGGLAFADVTIDERLGSYWQLPSRYEDVRVGRPKPSPVKSRFAVREAKASGRD